MSLRTIVFHFIWWRVSWNFLNGCIYIFLIIVLLLLLEQWTSLNVTFLQLLFPGPYILEVCQILQLRCVFFLTDRIDMSVWYHCISKTFIIKTGLLGCIVLLVYMTKFQSTVTIPPSSIGIGHTIFLHGDGFNVVISSNVFSYPIMLIFKFIWD